MKIIKKMTLVVFIMSLWLSFSGCDDVLVEDPNATEEVDPGTGGEGDTGNGDNTTQPNGDENRPVIENQIFNETLIIDGHENDSLLIRNCTFENMNEIALVIRTVDHLVIRDCIFRNLKSHAVFLQEGQSSDDIVIEGNEIYNVSGIGIFAGENHINTKCLNNKLYDVALVDEEGHTPHGIYLCGKNFTITGNTIYKCGSVEGKGLGISVRSCGTISQNKIYEGKASGIGFSSDHPSYGEPLLIENNVIYDNFENAITLYMSNEYSTLGRVTVRFNTLLSKDKPVVYANSWKSMESELEALGNILIRTDGDSKYIDCSTSNPFVESKNLGCSGNIGFKDFAKRDFRLVPGAEALNFAVGINDFPEFDKENVNRSSSSLDAGAYEADF